MPFINNLPKLSAMFDDIDKRVRRLETAYRFSAPVVNGTPSYLKNGDMWVDSTTGKLYAYYNGVTKLLATF